METSTVRAVADQFVYFLEIFGGVGKDSVFSTSEGACEESVPGSLENVSDERSMEGVRK